MRSGYHFNNRNMDNRKVLIATLTNLAYILAGWSMLQYDPSLRNPAGSVAVLGVLSGVHHYHLGTKRSNSTRKLDYLGMYLVLISLLLVGAGLVGQIGAALAVLLSLVVIFTVGVSRVAVGVGIMAVFIILVKSNPAGALHASSFGAIAFVFNYMGDNPHDDIHSLVHGLGWHVPTGYALFLTGVYLI